MEEFKNKTEENVYKQVINASPRLKEKIKDTSLLSFQKTKSKNYAVFYNNICLGIFILAEYIDKNELKECGWELKAGTFGN